MSSARYTARKTPPAVVDISPSASTNDTVHRPRKPTAVPLAPKHVPGDDSANAISFAEFDDEIEEQQGEVAKRTDRLMKLAMAAAFVFVALVGAIAVATRSESTQPPEALALIVEGDAPTIDTPTGLPDSLTYSINETDNVEGLNRSIDVTLSKELTSPELEVLATQLRGDPENFDRTFMGFTIEGQETGWYWATVLFDPDMVVRIRDA